MDRLSGIENEHRTSNVQHRILNGKNESLGIGCGCFFIFVVKEFLT
ncbi:MAG: hypothetical protein J7J07_04970 [Syntrophobacterales bacterium]|nr:hypothetical protein [Syntrophobacterales bacterium]